MGFASSDADAPSFSGRIKSGRPNPYSLLAPEEARVRAIAEVVDALIQGVRDGRDVDLNGLKAEVCHGCTFFACYCKQ